MRVNKRQKKRCIESVNEAARKKMWIEKKRESGRETKERMKIQR